MRTVVFVHGAWQGASSWEAVADIIKDQARAFTPTLTGLGYRQHQLSETTRLTTHVQDIVQLIDYERIHKATFVGHSYAGLVLAAVYDQRPAAIERIILIDAFFPRDGESGFSLMPAPVQEMFLGMANQYGEGWRLPGVPPLLDAWGLTSSEHRDFVQSKLCDFSLNCFQETLQLTTPHAFGDLHGVYLAGGDGREYASKGMFEPFMQRAREANWEVHRMPSGHDVHIECPADVAKFILR